MKNKQVVVMGGLLTFGDDDSEEVIRGYDYDKCVQIIRQQTTQYLKEKKDEIESELPVGEEQDVFIEVSNVDIFRRVLDDNNIELISALAFIATSNILMEVMEELGFKKDLD